MEDKKTDNENKPPVTSGDLDDFIFEDLYTKQHSEK